MSAAQVEVVVYNEPPVLSDPQPTFSRSGPSFPRLRAPSALEIAVSAFSDELEVFRREREKEIPAARRQARLIGATAEVILEDLGDLKEALEQMFKGNISRETYGKQTTHLFIDSTFRALVKAKAQSQA